MKTLKPGMRLKSAVSDVEIMVVKGNPGIAVNLCCGGEPVLEMGEQANADASRADIDGETLMGKRYVNAEQSIELLCTRGGQGALSVDDTPMTPREARALPSSD